MICGCSTRHVSTGPIDADGADPSSCRFVEAKYSATPQGGFKSGPVPDWYKKTRSYRETIDELRRYQNAILTSNHSVGAQPLGVIIRTNQADHLTFWTQMSSDAGLTEVEVQWFP